MVADRWFLHLFDSSLRQSCGYNGPTPYWDWSRDHAHLINSPIFEDSPEYGLGGTGDCDSSPEADCVVTTGAFAPSTDNFELAWPIPHQLRRNLTLITGWWAHERPQNSTLGPEFVRTATEHTTGDFFKFQYAMSLMHNHVHNFVGGDLAGDCPKGLRKEDCQDMEASFTPNEPLFWLHHAQLDRLWSKVRFASISPWYKLTDLSYTVAATPPIEFCRLLRHTPKPGEHVQPTLRPPRARRSSDGLRCSECARGAEEGV
jgi:tyrosinase